ncbi:carbohydrate sulfotransferase 8-like [Penaeus japonicus]|uniref:carbohydrate sulfotransferase 8-like n=1 Tax=Penaeus japonicus TaxID=27405 RepID=UPI001C712ACD|nr:carbohydrate sulfotransferase 8-like [Penaeus japonicus]
MSCTSPNASQMVPIRVIFFKFLPISLLLAASYLFITQPRAIAHLTPFSRWSFINESEVVASVDVLDKDDRYMTQYQVPHADQPMTDMGSGAWMEDLADPDVSLEQSLSFTYEGSSQEYNQSSYDNVVKYFPSKETLEQDTENQEPEAQETETQEPETQETETQETEAQKTEAQETKAQETEAQETQPEGETKAQEGLAQEEMPEEAEGEENDDEEVEKQEEWAQEEEDLVQSGSTEINEGTAKGRNKSASEATVRNFQETMRERFKERRARLETACAKFRPSLPFQARKAREEALFFVKKYNFLTCLSPKVGTTTWKTHLLRMWGYAAKFKTPHRYNNFIGIGYNKKLFKTYKATVQMTRVITVRHPLSRLASAFRNKLGDGKPIIPPSHHIYDIYRMVLGHAHIKAFRWKENTATFVQFLNYVISEAESNAINPHWRPYLWTCKPCGISYDYIVKLETFSDDLLYLATAAGISEIKTDLRENQSPALEEKVTDYEEYFKHLPPQVLKDVYRIYKYDFLFFGYDVPEAMLEASKEEEEEEEDL